MKEYKYKINGNLYNVVIGDIDDNIAHVEVNGTHYNVEMEKKQKLLVQYLQLASQRALFGAADLPQAL